MMWVYLAASITLVITLVLAWWQPRYRRQLLWGAVFTLPLVILDLIFAGAFTRLGIDLSDAIVTVLMTVLGAAAGGALLAVLYEVTINRWLTPTGPVGRHHLWWLTGSICLGAIAVMFGAPPLLAIAICLLVDMIFVLLVARELLWDVLLGVGGFAVWFALADAIYGLRTSGDITGLLLGPQPLGLTIAGLPIERLLIVAGLGALISPLFIALRGRRFPDQNIITTSPAKMLVGALMSILVTVGAAWFTLDYIRTPQVLAMTPTVDATAVATNSSLTFQFSLPVDRSTLQLNLQPAVSGAWRFEQPTMFGHAYRTATYIFDAALPPNTTFTGQITGIHSLWGLTGNNQLVSFTTVTVPVATVPTIVPVQPTTNTNSINTNAVIPPTTNTVSPVNVNVPNNTNATITNTAVVIPPAKTTTPPATNPAPRKILSVAVHYQEQPLSCEAAALKMALAAAGVTVSEKQIMAIVGYDPTPHRGNIWGDPNSAFVGNIAGKQDTTGYGVYWGPIQRAASNWRPATIITNGQLTDLTAAIDAGHAVVIWGTIGAAYRDDWKTTSGKTILAWKGEHARTLIGYVGSANNPSQFIINDPVVGRITWSAAALTTNWARFNNSGVVVQ